MTGRDLAATLRPILHLIAENDLPVTALGVVDGFVSINAGSVAAVHQWGLVLGVQPADTGRHLSTRSMMYPDLEVWTRTAAPAETVKGVRS